MAQTILLFESSEEKSRTIQAICQTLGIRMQRMTPVDYKQTLGALAGIQGFPKKKLSNVETASLGEMLVFSGMDSDQVDAFLMAYRASGQAAVALKAVLTPYNIRWTPEQLYAELQREYKYYKSY